MDNPQKQADRVREMVADSDAVRRLGIEVIRAVGTEEGVTLRARRDATMLEAARGPEWLSEQPQRLADTLTRDLVADVFAPPARPLADRPPRWGIAADRASRRPRYLAP